MSVMASQITSLPIVYSTVYSGTDQRKHQSSASLAFCEGNSPHKGPVTRKKFPFGDVIMHWPAVNWQRAMYISAPNISAPKEWHLGHLCPDFGAKRPEDIKSVLHCNNKKVVWYCVNIGLPIWPSLCLQMPLYLTVWGHQQAQRDIMADNFLPTILNAFSWIKIYEFRLRFHWSLLWRLQLTIFQHCHLIGA